MHEVVAVRLRDAKTGEERRVTGVTLWGWTEGNWACDCNRAQHFGREDDTGYCAGRCRYRVVDVEPMPDGYTLADFNADYPAEDE